jgi:hypothetical protein
MVIDAQTEDHPESAVRATCSVYHGRVRGSYVVQLVRAVGSPTASRVVVWYVRIFLSQHPADLSILVGVQGSVVLPGQDELSS